MIRPRILPPVLRSIPYMLCLLTVSCAGDPFDGFFAHPSGGALDLRRTETEGRYTGSLWVDVMGPIPVEVKRDGNVARGLMTYGGRVQPIEVENSGRGLIVTIEGVRGENAWQRYKDGKDYANRNSE
jgi:hypothetical protein